MCVAVARGPHLCRPDAYKAMYQLKHSAIERSARAVYIDLQSFRRARNEVQFTISFLYLRLILSRIAL
jgi:hypothetical protein